MHTRCLTKCLTESYCHNEVTNTSSAGSFTTGSPTECYVRNRDASRFGSASTAEEVTEGIDATNLTAIVTGGSSGLGLETARVLALRGAQVIIAARNLNAANEAKQLILKEKVDARINVLKLDLSSIKSVKEFVDDFNDLELPLNILINNAGISLCPHQLSEDGIELQFATNHIGHFHLTNLVLDKMINTAKIAGIEGRIVNISSSAHSHTYEEGIRLNISDKDGYSFTLAYGHSKLANILHANELSRRLQEQGANVTVNSLNPGYSMTKVYRHVGLFLPMNVVKVLTFWLWKSIGQAAATTCYVALHPSVKGVTGKYFQDCKEMKPSELATNEVLAKKLWDLSDKLVVSA